MSSQFDKHKISISCKVIFITLSSGTVVDLALEDLESFINQNCVKQDNFWMCQFCGQLSSNSGNIKSHIEARHARMPPVQCNMCDKQCKTRDSLRKHKQKDHPHLLQ